MKGNPQARQPLDGRDTVKSATSLIQALASGARIAPAAVAEVKAQLLSDLSGHSSARRGEAERQLSEIYRHIPDRPDRWELAGSVVSLGTAGTAVLKEFATTDRALEFLQDIARLPVGKQLEAAFDFLLSLMPALAHHESDGPSGPGRSDPPRVIAGRGSRREDEGVEQVPSDLRAVLRNDALPASARFDAAQRLGPLAIPVLLEMVEQSDVSREVAVQCFLALDASDARVVVARALEQIDRRDPTLASYLRDRMENDGSDSRHARSPGGAAPMSDAWLAEAVKHADRVSVLQAGTGREARAISLLLRRCAELHPGR